MLNFLEKRKQCHMITISQKTVVVLVVENPPASIGDITDSDSISGWGTSPGGGHGNPLQYSCLEVTMDRGAWRANIDEVAKRQT